MFNHVFLITFFQALVAVTRKRALILDVVDNRHCKNTQGVLLHVRTIIQGVFTVSTVNLNVKHGNDRADQVLHERLLLGDQQRPSLQVHQRDVDRINRWRHRVCDDPPQV